MKFVPKGPIDNKPALVQIMAWRRIGDKPLHEPMPTQFTDLYGTRGRWVKSWSTSVQVMPSCRRQAAFLRTFDEAISCEIVWHALESSFTAYIQAIIYGSIFEIDYSKISNISHTKS